MPIFQEKLEVMTFIDPETKESDEFDKPYLVLLCPTGEYDKYADVGDGFREFEGIAARGRRLVFDQATSDLGNYDLIHSYVLSGKIPLGKEVSLYTFLRLCITQYFRTSSPITLDELNEFAYETSGIDPDKIDLDVLFSREANRPSK